MTSKAVKAIGIDFGSYLDMPGENATQLKAMLVSPLLYQWQKGRGRPDADHLRVGRAVHTAVFEPDRFVLDFAVWNETTESGRSSPRSGGKWAAFCAEHARQTILTAAQYESATAIATAVRSNPVAARLLAVGEPEVSISWRHGATGLPCKSRLDFLSPLALCELKTTRDPSPGMFASQAARLRYPLQLAFYEAAVESLGGEVPPAKIIAAQNQAPWDVVVYDVPTEILDVGGGEYEQALVMVAHCLRTGQYPGIGHGEEQTMHLPKWALPPEDPITFGDESMFGEVT